MARKNQSTSNLYNFVIGKPDQLNQFDNLSIIRFALKFNVGFNVLISRASLIFLLVLPFKSYVGALTFTSVF